MIIVVAPSGRIVRFPRGTTAGEAALQYASKQGLFYGKAPLGDVALDLAGKRLTNWHLCWLGPFLKKEKAIVAPAGPARTALLSLNNRLVPANTPLKDGDVLVMPQEPAAVF